MTFTIQPVIDAANTASQQHTDDMAAAAAALSDVQAQLTAADAAAAGLQTSLDAATAQLAKSRPVAYTVQAGDTLTSIAKALGVDDWHKLQKWNGLSSTTIKAGQQLLAVTTTDPAPVPSTGTIFGVNCSTKTQHDSYAALLGKVGVWRYYHQPGEALTYPTEYQLGPGEQFVISGKINPKALTIERMVAAGHPVLLPQHMTTSMMVALFQACPTDRDTYFCVWHEPKDQLAAGVFTKADLDAAWVRARAAQQQVGDHIVLIPILEGIAFLAGNNPDSELPADPGTYDVVGVDPYFSGSIGQPIANLGPVLDTIKAKADSLGKPWAICETGVGQNLTGQARLDALTQLAQAVRARDAVFCCYFLGNDNTTQWKLSASDGSAAAWLAGQTG